MSVQSGKVSGGLSDTSQETVETTKPTKSTQIRKTKTGKPRRGTGKKQEPQEVPGPPPESKATQPIKRDGSRKRRVKVYRMDGNRHLPIVVCVNSRKNRREFLPGEEVELTEQLIGALKDAVIEHDLPVPNGSGVYESGNPISEALRQNPGWDARLEVMTGTIYITKSQPVYVVNYLD